MTRKDYVLIAETIAKQGRYNSDAVAVIESLSLDIADALAQENPRFDRARFLTACGVK